MEWSSFRHWKRSLKHIQGCSKELSWLRGSIFNSCRDCVTSDHKHPAGNPATNPTHGSYLNSLTIGARHPFCILEFDRDCAILWTLSAVTLANKSNWLALQQIDVHACQKLIIVGNKCCIMHKGANILPFQKKISSVFSQPNGHKTNYLTVTTQITMQKLAIT